MSLSPSCFCVRRCGDDGLGGNSFEGLGRDVFPRCTPDQPLKKSEHSVNIPAGFDTPGAPLREVLIVVHSFVLFPKIRLSVIHILVYYYILGLDTISPRAHLPPSFPSRSSRPRVPVRTRSPRRK